MRAHIRFGFRLWRLLAPVLVATSSFGGSMNVATPMTIEGTINIGAEIKSVPRWVTPMVLEVAAGDSSNFIVLSDTYTPIATVPGALLTAPFTFFSGKFMTKGDAAHCVWRINGDGTRDLFDSPSIQQSNLSAIRDIAIDATGKLVVLCNAPVTTLSATKVTTGALLRIETSSANDGHIDETFLAPSDLVGDRVFVVDQQTFVVTLERRLVALAGDGSVIGSFHSGVFDGGLGGVSQRFGKYFVVGDFTHVDATPPGPTHLKGF